MADNQTVYIEFKGDVSGLQSALKQVEGSFKAVDKQLKETNADTKTMSATMVAAGGVMANVFTKLAGEALKFGKEFITAYVDVGKEVRSLQRVLGGSAEEMSRLRFAAEEVGVGTDTLVRGMRILSTHLSANDKQAKQLGITYRDTNGQLLPSTEIIARVSDRFSTMRPGLERTNLAVKAFGRSATEMLPLLSLGGEKIRELGAEADKLGLTMSGKDLQAVKEYSMNQRHLKAAIQGVQLTIGRELVPMLTKAMQYVIDNVIPNFKAMADGLVGKGGVSESLSGSAKTFYTWGSYLRGVITVIKDFRTQLLIIGGVLTTMWAVNKVTAAVGAIVAIISTLTAAWTGVTAAATAAAVAEDVASGGTLTVVQAAAGAAALAGVGALIYKVTQKVKEQAAQFDVPTGTPQAISGGGAPDLTAPNLDVPKLTTGGTKTKGKSRYEKEKAKLDALMEGLNTYKSNLAVSLSNASSDQARLTLERSGLNQIKNMIELLRAEEKKTRGTKAHHLALQDLNKALMEQARLQNMVANTTDKIAAAHAKAAEKAKKQAEETARMNREIARLNSSFTANNSWLAAQTRASGPQRENFGGFIEVPVVIDGQTVFRATQKYSLLNNRRNVANGLTTSGSLI